MTIQEKIYAKLLSEYNSFLEHLRELPPDKIIDHAYEKVMKEEILSFFNDDEYLTDEMALQFYAHKVDLDDIYNNYMKLDVSISEVVESSNEYFFRNLLDLPGQEIEGENIKGYSVKRAIFFDTNRGFAFAHNPNAVSPYVTWQFTQEPGDKPDFYWGKYYGNEEDALANFVERANDYSQANNVKEKSLPDSAELDQDRLYKAEIHNPDEPEYPKLEVFHAPDDAAAVNHAHELVSGEVAGAYLLEVHELDENYDSIRQIDLMRHDPSLRRFMDVDLIDFMGQIADKTIAYHPKDFTIDVEELWKVAITENPSDKRLMWHCSMWGTHILDENEVFIRDTGAYGFWVTYRPDEPTMLGYVIEVTGHKNLNGEDTVVGNVYEVGDYYPHTQYVKETASVLDAVSLTYAPDWGINAGKTITVPKFEYDQDRHRLMSESGNVSKIQYHPWEGIKTMAQLLQYEHATRMAMPIGDPQEHLQKVADKMAEIRGVPEQPQKPTSQPAKEPSFEEILQAAQAKADAINRQNALNKGQEPITKTEPNPALGE